MSARFGKRALLEVASGIVPAAAGTADRVARAAVTRQPASPCYHAAPGSR